MEGEPTVTKAVTVATLVFRVLRPRTSNPSTVALQRAKAPAARHPLDGWRVRGLFPNSRSRGGGRMEPEIEEVPAWQRQR
jgi:hypothetical protein